MLVDDLRLKTPRQRVGPIPLFLGLLRFNLKEGGQLASVVIQHFSLNLKVGSPI
jgi:hypothetical protein